MESKINYPDEKIREKLFIASGQTHPELALGVAEQMGLKLGDICLYSHPDTESYVRIDESIRGKHVLAFQSHGARGDKSKGDSFLEHLNIINAAYLSKAAVVIAVSPNLIGSRGDRQVRPRESVPAHLYLSMLREAGATNLVTVDLHSPATLGSFRGPVDHLTAQPQLIEALREKIVGDPEQYVVVSPDEGHTKDAAKVAEELELDVISMSKGRDPNDSKVIVHAKRVDGIHGRVCFLIDDMIDTAGTLDSATRSLKESGAEAIYAAAIHPWLSEPGIERLKASPIDEIIVTDTLPTEEAQKELGHRLKVLSIKEMLARSLIEIVTNGSVSTIQGGRNYR